MKTIKYLILIIIAVGSFVSCEDDFLVTIPTDRISESVFWRTDADAEYAANAIYPFLLESTFVYTLWDAMSDIGHVTLQWREESYLEKGAHNSANGKIVNEWEHAYRGIQAANIFLDNVGNVKTTDQAKIDRLTAEVKTIRAYLYVSLAILYGDVPLSKNELTLETSKQLTRTPVAQVWDFVSAELTDAANVLPVKAGQPGRITKGAALAIKARAMLYAQRYTEAASAAKAVMDLQEYEIYPKYENLFSYTAENSKEAILTRQHMKNTNKNDIFNNLTPNSIWAQKNQVVPTRAMVDMYDMANGKDINDPTSGFDPFNPYVGRDPRLNFSIYVPGDIMVNNKVLNPLPGSGTGDEIGKTVNTGYSGFYIRKYLNVEDMPTPDNCGIDIMLIRYPEVLLTYAEAKIEADQIDGTVLKAINDVRQRPDVLMPVITTTDQSELRNIVRKERCVELAFEALRYFDIRRWRIAEDVIPGIIKGMTYVEDGELVTIELSGWAKAFNKERDYLWPIPFNEIVLNPLLTQNPGY